MAGQIIKRWVVVKREGLRPVAKVPLRNTHEGIITLLRELVVLDINVRLTVVELFYGNVLGVEDGYTYLRNDEILSEE